MRCRLSQTLSAGLICAPLVGYAAHPLISEDAATQGKGAFELEIGNSWMKDGGTRTYELGPQLSYGITPHVDAILRPTWLDVRITGAESSERSRGAGDTAVDVKWRFLETETVHFALRAGLNAPTGDAERGLGAGKPTYHGVLVASFGSPSLAVHANLGYTRNRADPSERRDLYHASTALLWTVDESWRLLLADVAVDSNPDRSMGAWPAVWRVGAIYTVRKGFDLDIGTQARLNRAAPSHVVLAGLTVRWGGP
jgi:hypothetical protein